MIICEASEVERTSVVVPGVVGSSDGSINNMY